MVNNRESHYQVARFTMCRILIILPLVVFMFLTGCRENKFSSPFRKSGLSGLYEYGIPASAPWAVLPFIGLKESKYDTLLQLERMLTVLLPSSGINNAKLYSQFQEGEIENDRGGLVRQHDGLDWAIQNGISFAVMGEILNWIQKEDDGSIYLTFKVEVIDVRSGETLWNKTGKMQGSPGQDELDVARNLLTDLLATLPIQRVYSEL